MAVDKGYGSGKSRSAANSAARRRAATGRMTKGKKKPADIIASKARQSNVNTDVAGFNIGGRKYLETGVSANKLGQVWNALRAAQGGLSSNTLAMGSRIRAGQIGRATAKNIAQARDLASTAKNSGPFPIGPVARMLPSMLRDQAKVSGFAARSGARRLFPQVERAAKEAAQAARTKANIMKRGR